MSIEALDIIRKALVDELKLHYEFGTWSKKGIYPYWVGEYQDIPPMNEDGMQETTFILTGFTRGKWLELVKAKEAIEKHFNKIHGKTVIAESGSAVAVFYSDSFNIPTGDAELKKIQINLDVKEWKVN